MLSQILQPHIWPLSPSVENTAPVGATCPSPSAPSADVCWHRGASSSSFVLVNSVLKADMRGQAPHPLQGSPEPCPALCLALCTNPGPGASSSSLQQETVPLPVDQSCSLITGVGDFV